MTKQLTKSPEELEREKQELLAWAERLKVKKYQNGVTEINRRAYESVNSNGLNDFSEVNNGKVIKGEVFNSGIEGNIIGFEKK